MKDSPHTPDTSHSAPESLLKKQLVHTTPSFEARWTDLKRDWRREAAPDARRPFWTAWSWRLGLPATLVLALVFSRGLFLTEPGPVHTQLIEEVRMADLTEWDVALDQALPLLDPDLLDTLTLLLAQADPTR